MDIRNLLSGITLRLQFLAPAASAFASARALLNVGLGSLRSETGGIPESPKRMPYGMYISAEGAMVQDRRLEVVANNLANVDTTGFKRQLAAFQARFAAANERGLEIPGDCGLADIGGGVMIRDTQTDFSPGPLKVSKRPTDFAIDGDAFFAVQKGQQTMLTRAGNFLFNAEGTLVTEQGYPVLSENGNPVAIDPDAGPWQFQPDGSIVQEGNIQQLALKRPRSLDDLSHAAENLFSVRGRMASIAPEERHVRQGFVEASGVKATQEMMAMIEASRAFECNVNMIKNQDSMIGNLVSRVLREN